MSTIVIKGTLDDWLSLNHPTIPRSSVHFANGSFVQDNLNPFVIRYIVVYSESDGRIHLKGCFKYGDDYISSMAALNVWKMEPVPEPMEEDDDEIVIDDEACSIDDVKRRIDWILSSSSETRPFDGAFFILQCIGPYVDEFYQRQMAKEYANFQRTKFTRSEKAIANFLRAYGLADKLTLLADDEVEVYDLRRVWTEWGVRTMPRVWLKVPMEELDGQTMKLYPGGYYHAILLDIVPSWIWKRWTVKYGKRKRIVHPDQMRHLIAYMRRRLDNEQEMEKRRAEVVPPETHQLPPCVQAILSAPRFPQDRDRQNLVRIFSNAKVPLEYVKTTLERLNEQYPHNDGATKDAKARWDYEYHYRQNYAPPKCEAMCDACPFKFERVDLRKVECFKTFAQRFPEKRPPNPKSFRGPSNWLEW